jgi:hypothetical protein
LTGITSSRAELIAKSHPCGRCGEYSYKRVVVKRAPDSQREALSVEWLATLVCGICGSHQDRGISDDGDLVYES